MSETSKDKKLVGSATSESLPEGIKRALVDDKPKKRVFKPEYKLEILERLEECRGKRGAVCKPTSFQSMEGTDSGAIESDASESQDAVGFKTRSAMEEAIEAIEVTSTETKLQVPVVTPPNTPELSKIACAEAKKNDSLKAKVIPIFFPAKTMTCEFEKNDSLSRKNEVVRARREEYVELPLQGVTRLCQMKFDASKQNMRFDDEIFIRSSD